MVFLKKPKNILHFLENTVPLHPLSLKNARDIN